MKVTLLDIAPTGPSLKLPLYSSRVPAGFPSPADDYLEQLLDLNTYLIKRPSSTFFVRAEGTSMVNAGILHNALLVVDRSLEAKHDDIVIAALDGQLTCKILDTKIRALRSANLSYPPMMISEGNEVDILGVVIHIINSPCTRS
jgi:DNA polymerase V